MSVAVARRDTCRLCDSEDVKLVVNLNPVPLAEKYTSSPEEAKNAPKYPIDIYMCGKCSHVQLLDVIDSKDLWSDYTYHSGQTQGIVNHFKEVSDNIISKYQPTPGSLIIDVGSNDGTLLRYFKNAGYRVHGIDPAKEIAAKATASGIETTPSVITKEVAKTIREKHGPAAVVTAFNVYAHADNLGDMTDAIRILLADDGIFMFEVQYLMDIVDKVLLGTIFHEHMSHHSLKPMLQFLKAHDLEMIDVERVSIQKGSIIGVAQPIGGPRKVSASVGELLKLEEDRKLDKIVVMEEFNKRIERNRQVARDLMASWNQQHLIVAGYGAARSGPTLMAQFEFDKAIQYIFDDHPQKVNRFSPGNGVPVLPTSELMNKKPDVVVILAWIHARAIIEKSQEYLNAGGKFVICTPDVRVIDKDHPL
jgi:SAM-dependent methyltransferase